MKWTLGSGKFDSTLQLDLKLSLFVDLFIVAGFRQEKRIKYIFRTSLEGATPWHDVQH